MPKPSVLLNQQEAEVLYFKYGFTLEDSYRGALVNHKIRCNACKHLTDKSLNSAKQGNGCGKCFKNLKLIQKEAEQEYLKYGFTLIDSYINSRTPHKARCLKNDHNTTKRLNALKVSGCNECRKLIFYKDKIHKKLATVLRSRFGVALRDFLNDKRVSSVSDLGCSLEEVKQYLESLWLPGMTWENWSRTGWHIDHIRPFASFNMDDPEEQKKAVHYTNLQPLWAHDNISKGAKYDQS